VSSSPWLSLSTSNEKGTSWLRPSAVSQRAGNMPESRISGACALPLQPKSPTSATASAPRRDPIDATSSTAFASKTSAIPAILCGCRRSRV